MGYSRRGAARGVDLPVLGALVWQCAVHATDHGEVVGMFTSKKSMMMANCLNFFRGNVKEKQPGLKFLNGQRDQ